jgi:hypothetical protein
MTRKAFPGLGLPLLALLAFAVLVVMVVVGAQPRQRQLVKFEARGVLRSQPQTITRITLDRGGQHVALARREGESWVRESSGAVAASAAAHLTTAVNMLHRSAPVRELTTQDLAGVDTRPFGLQEEAFVVALSGSSGPALTVRFGAHNPEGYLQYMRIEGDPSVYLMSRFIGAEWLAAWQGVEAR